MARSVIRYPVTSRRGILHCPVHHCAVALNEDGRVKSQCPECRREAVRALRRLQKQ